MAAWGPPKEPTDIDGGKAGRVPPPATQEELVATIERGTARERIEAAWQLCLLAEENPASAPEIAKQVQGQQGTAAQLVYEWLVSRYGAAVTTPGIGTDRDWERTDPTTGETEPVVNDGRFNAADADAEVHGIFRMVHQEPQLRTYAGLATIDGKRQAVSVQTYRQSKTVDSQQLQTAFTERLKRWLTVADHPNILTVHDSGVAPQPWLLLGYSTETLHTVGALPPQLAVRIGRDLGRAIATAHEHGITHGWLDPRRVVLDRRTPDPVPRVFGFGMEPVMRTTRGHHPIEKRFAAPEYARDNEAIDWMTDIFHLGGILYASLTGHPPFEQPPQQRTDATPTPPSERTELSARVDTPILKALTPRKITRYESADEFVQDLQTLVETGGL